MICALTTPAPRNGGSAMLDATSPERSEEPHGSARTREADAMRPLAQDGLIGAGFEEFAAAETPRLLRIAYGLTGNPHDAWDLVQESLVRVAARWHRLVDGSPGG